MASYDRQHQLENSTVRAAVSAIGCREAIARLWEYLDGELDAARVTAVRAHVGGCGSCGARHDARRALLTTLARSGRADAASPALRERVARMLHDQGLTS